MPAINLLFSNGLTEYFSEANQRHKGNHHAKGKPNRDPVSYFKKAFLTGLAGSRLSHAYLAGRCPTGPLAHRVYTASPKLDRPCVAPDSR